MFIIRNVPWGEEACHGAPEDGLEQEQCSPRHNQVICCVSTGDAGGDANLAEDKDPEKQAHKAR